MIGMLFDFFFGSEVTRNQLGKGDGNPHFTPPPYSAANDLYHGIAPGGKYSRAHDKRGCDND